MLQITDTLLKCASCHMVHWSMRNAILEMETDCSLSNSANSSGCGSDSEISPVIGGASSGSEMFIAHCKYGHRSLLLT